VKLALACGALSRIGGERLFRAEGTNGPVLYPIGSTRAGPSANSPDYNFRDKPSDFANAIPTSRSKL
jgi:hypothetical protein